MPRNVVALLDNEECRAMVAERCRAHGMRIAEFEELVQAEVEQTGKQKRRGLRDAFDDILDRIQDEGGNE